MARFDVEQAAAVAAIKQVIYEWGDELDLNNGSGIKDANILTADCRYFVGDQWREGIGQIGEFYQQRLASMKAAGPVLVMRHIISNEKVAFLDESRAKIDFLLTFFAKAGDAPFVDYCDPLAVADVQMECSKESDGHWRISMFTSGQIFRRG